MAAFQAQLLYAQGRFEPSHSARVVAAARARSTALDPVTAQDVLDSPPTADPLRELDRAPLLDCASALVLADGDNARRLGRTGVRIVATASRTAAYWSQRPDLHIAPQARAAAEDALSIAGWELSDARRGRDQRAVRPPAPDRRRSARTRDPARTWSSGSRATTEGRP